MPEDTITRQGNATAKPDSAMRIFIFKSEKSPDLRAFGGDLVGARLPTQFKPWRAIGAIAPDREPPYNLSRQLIETAINDCGYQLWRMSKKNAASD
jgi:hypothetical protein